MDSSPQPMLPSLQTNDGQKLVLASSKTQYSGSIEYVSRYSHDLELEFLALQFRFVCTLRVDFLSSSSLFKNLLPSACHYTSCQIESVTIQLKSLSAVMCFKTKCWNKIETETKQLQSLHHQKAPCTEIGADCGGMIIYGAAR